MIRKVNTLALTSAIILCSADLTANETPEFWYESGIQTVQKNIENAKQAAKNSQQQAKSIILFIGDGMGVATVTAARILEGQRKGMKGEENILFFEHFPNVALTKTYNTNQQTPDSAGTMTAIMSGVKTDAGVIGVNQNIVRGDCDSQKTNEVISALELAELAGMSTGVVTTARITHATPAATYAHIMDRNFEDDRDARKFSNPGNCKDIASQLIDLPSRFDGKIDGLEVALGGGRRSFIRRISGADPEYGGKGERIDGRDLTQEWLNQYQNSAYVWNKTQFDSIDTDNTDHLLGLFEMSHMKYNLDINTDAAGEPSLTQMTSKAIAILKKNNKGFFLHVESGRIDHAHHATNPARALDDAIEFANAVKYAYENTDPGKTLIIVTADHSHVFSMAGYPTRGNPILGKVIGNDSSGNAETTSSLAADNLPYTTLGYINGRGFSLLADKNSADAIYKQAVNLQGRADLTAVNTENKDFHSETLVPMHSETHSGEDVAVYATGPGSSLISGVMEQNVLFHVMNKAAELEKRAEHNMKENK